MKRIISILTSLISCVCVFAQEPERKNEFQLGGGVYAYLEGDYTLDFNYLPTYTFSYMRKLNKVISLGASFTYIHKTDKGEFISESYDDKGQQIGSYHLYYKDVEKVMMFMGHLRTTFFDRKHVRMYARLAVGPGFDYNRYHTNDYFGSYQYVVREEENIDLIPAFQITPFGIELGTEKLKGYMELGLGVQGFVNVGIAHSF